MTVQPNIKCPTINIMIRNLIKLGHMMQNANENERRDKMEAVNILQHRRRQV
jgi:hypothetical protein